jgi:salicylate hydroxylase
MKIAIAGVGVAGGVIATGLARLPGVELVAFEKVGPDDHAVAGNGLNVGPNALLALDRALPELAARLRALSLPWRRWRASTMGGEPLYQVPLSEVAACDGLRIRWAELYRACRGDPAPGVRYRAEVQAVHRPDPQGPLALTVRTADGSCARVEGVDLLVVAEGRYSALREQLCGPPAVTQLGVANFRVLLRDDGAWPIDDLEQWFTGPHRLLAFRLRDGLVYLSGNLPIDAGQPVPEAHRTAAWLAARYAPPGTAIDAVPRRLLEGACAAADAGGLHWSRLQESTVRWRDRDDGRVLFVGDAAHAMVPTLGQGATTAIEDGAAFVETFAETVGDAAATDADVPALLRRFEARRRERVDFVRAFSWEASDVIMAERFTLDGVRAKGRPAYRAKLARLYAGR